MSRFRAALPLILAAPALAQRPVYPYSMVDGGIADNAEWQAHKHDPAYRFSGFRLDARACPAQVRTRKNSRGILRYVSFRKDGAVVWTDHPILISGRENVLAIDGKIAVRGRCGNLLAVDLPPYAPRTPFVPPDTPFVPAVDLPPMLQPLIPPMLPPLIPPTAPPVEWPPAGNPPGTPPIYPPAPPETPPIYPSPIYPPTPFPGGGGGGLIGAVSPARREIPIPIAAAPEPATIALSMAGLVLIAALKRRKR